MLCRWHRLNALGSSRLHADCCVRTYDIRERASCLSNGIYRTIFFIMNSHRALVNSRLCAPESRKCDASQRPLARLVCARASVTAVLGRAEPPRRRFITPSAAKKLIARTEKIENDVENEMKQMLMRARHGHMTKPIIWVWRV